MIRYTQLPIGFSPIAESCVFGQNELEVKIAVHRYCEPFIYQDLKKKMVFLSGPRQVGKATLAKALCRNHFADGEYLNWDVDNQRRAIMDKHWRADSPLVIFDELHKYPFL